MSSSEEENADLLKEALNHDLISDSLYKTKETLNLNDEKQNKTEKLPSLRPKSNENEQFDNIFRVTEQFRDHVSKKLSGLLDKKIKYVNVITKEKEKKRSTRVKLFRDSEYYLEVEGGGEINKEKGDENLNNISGSQNIKRKMRDKAKIKNITTKNNKTTSKSQENKYANKEYTSRPKIRKRIIEDDVLNEDEKCKAVAVNPKDILTKKELKSWSTWTKSPVYVYKKKKKNIFELVDKEFK